MDLQLLPVVRIGNGHKITQRNPVNKNLYDLIGRTLNSNCFPTLRGRLVWINDDRCYFEMIENDEFTKYNNCAGQIEYLPAHMVITMKFEEE
jgi:hypothetical protein